MHELPDPCPYCTSQNVRLLWEFPKCTHPWLPCSVPSGRLEGHSGMVAISGILRTPSFPTRSPPYEDSSRLYEDSSTPTTTTIATRPDGRSTQRLAGSHQHGPELNYKGIQGLQPLEGTPSSRRFGAENNTSDNTHKRSEPANRPPTPPPTDTYCKSSSCSCCYAMEHSLCFGLRQQAQLAVELA